MNTRNTVVLGGLLMFALVVGILAPGSFDLITSVDAADGQCAGNIQKLNQPGIVVSGLSASSHVRNNSSVTCTVSLASYKILTNRGGSAPHYIQGQTLFQYGQVQLGPGDTGTVSTGLPNCYTQVDLIIGDPIEPPTYSPSDMVGVQFANDLQYCDEPAPTPTPTPTPTPAPIPTPTPTPVAVSCSPAFQTVLGGTVAQFTAAGGTGSFSWFAFNGQPSTATGSVFRPFFPTVTSDQIYAVTVQSGNMFATCSIRALASQVTNANLGMSKTVRNLSTNSNEFESVTANPNETLEFVIRINNAGNTTATNVRVSDNLPSGLRFVGGSITRDGATWFSDLTNIFVGDLVPGATSVIRFRATVEPESFFVVGTTVLTNVATAFASNTSSVSDSATVQVVRANPVVIPGVISIQKFGRNVALGQAGELSSVTVRANDTIEFVIRVRNQSVTTLTNVIASDTLPIGMTYSPNSTSVGGTIVQEGIVSGGIIIGSLAPSQETVVRFSARMNNISSFNGSRTALNVASVRADNTPSVSAQLPLNFPIPLVQVAGVRTGAKQNMLFTLVLSSIFTFGYTRYARTGLFLRRDVSAALRRSQHDAQRLNFARFL